MKSWGYAQEVSNLRVHAVDVQDVAVAQVLQTGSELWAMRSGSAISPAGVVGSA